jgi:hypothetical protein
LLQRNSSQGISRAEETIEMYFLKTGSVAHLRGFWFFEPLVVVTSIVQPLATLPSITNLYFTHRQHAFGQSLTTWSNFALATLLWSSTACSTGNPRFMQQHHWAGDELADGECRPDERRMGLLKLQDQR